eukprot:scaffold50352_cov15-Tisochrysis_lutea.AAC.1
MPFLAWKPFVWLPAPPMHLPTGPVACGTILTILHPFITEAFFCTQVINKAIIGLLPAPSFVLLCQLLVSTVVPKALSSLGWIEVDALEWGKVRRFSIIAATVLITMYCNIQVTKRNAVCLPKWRLVSGWLHGRHCTCDVAIYMTALLKFSSACRAHAWLQAILALILSCSVGLGMSHSSYCLRENVSATLFTVVGIVCKLITVAINFAIWGKHTSAWGAGFLFIW